MTDELAARRKRATRQIEGYVGEKGSIIRVGHDNAHSCSVVLVSNQAGRIEPFVCEIEDDANNLAMALEGMPGSIDAILVYHGVEILDVVATDRFIKLAKTEREGN